MGEPLPLATPSERRGALLEDLSWLVVATVVAVFLGGWGLMLGMALRTPQAELLRLLMPLLPRAGLPLAVTIGLPVPVLLGFYFLCYRVLFEGWLGWTMGQRNVGLAVLSEQPEQRSVGLWRACLRLLRSPQAPQLRRAPRGYRTSWARICGVFLVHDIIGQALFVVWCACLGSPQALPSP